MRHLKSKLDELIKPGRMKVEKHFSSKFLFLFSHILFSCLAVGENFDCLEIVLPPVLISLSFTIFICSLRKSEKRIQRPYCLINLLNSFFLLSVFALTFIFSRSKINKAAGIDRLALSQTNFCCVYLLVSIINLTWCFKFRLVLIKILLTILICLSSLFYHYFVKFKDTSAYEWLSNIGPLICLSLVFSMLLRKKKEGSISKQILLKMLQDSPSGKLILKNRQIVFCNPAFTQMLGKNTKDTAGVSVEDLKKLRFNRYIKLTNNLLQSPLVRKMKRSYSFSSKNSSIVVGKQLDFDDIFENLRQSPHILHTYYTQQYFYAEQVGSLTRTSKKGSNDIIRLKSSWEIEKCMDSVNSQTEEEEVLEPEERKIEVKIGYIDWDKFGEDYVMILFTDVTEAQKIKEHETDKEFKINILNSFSHELQTPLNITKNMTDSMMEDPQVPSWIKENYCRYSQASLKLLHLLIQDIIDFLKIETGQFRLDPQIFPLKEVLKEVVSSLLTWSREGNTELIIETGPSITNSTKTYFDRSRLKRILVNLVANCIRHTTNGQVLLSAQATKDGEYSIIQIKQLNAGVQPEPPTYNSNQDFSNTIQSWDKDFRLIITKMLAKELRRFGLEELVCEITSDGLSFSLMIPLTIEESSQDFFGSDKKIMNPNLNEADLTHDSSSMKEFKKNETKKRTVLVKKKECPNVLIVDDDPFNLLSMELILKKLNICSIRANNGREAINIMTQYKQSHKCEEADCAGIQFIFMDLMMPVMDGIEASRELNLRMKNKEIKEVPIIACTANDSSSFENLAKEAGMQSFISKPVGLNKVTDVLRSFGLVS